MCLSRSTRTPDGASRTCKKKTPNGYTILLETYRRPDCRLAFPSRQIEILRLESRRAYGLERSRPMPRNEAKRQKRLQKQKAKRKEKRFDLAKRTSADPTIQFAGAGDWPIIEALEGKTLWQDGI